LTPGETPGHLIVRVESDGQRCYLVGDLLHHGCEVVHLDWAPPGSYLTDIFNEAAIRFIREHREQPFFLYLPHFAVHTPLHAKPQVISKYKLRDKRPGLRMETQHVGIIQTDAERQCQDRNLDIVRHEICREVGVVSAKPVFLRSALSFANV
jgi:hypothetical protein